MLGWEHRAGDIMRTVDKLEKIGPEKVRALLVEQCGAEEEQGRPAPHSGGPHTSPGAR